jgi:hypothetical protein
MSDMLELNKKSAEIRGQRADLKKSFKGMDQWEARDRMADLLISDLPRCAETMRIRALLAALPRIGDARLNYILASAQCPDLPLNLLTWGERESVAKVLKG